MRLGLGRMFTDLGARLKVSRTTACDIFATWLPLAAKYMHENVIFWPSQDTLARIWAKSFQCNLQPNSIHDAETEDDLEF